MAICRKVQWGLLSFSSYTSVDARSSGHFFFIKCCFLVRRLGQVHPFSVERRPRFHRHSPWLSSYIQQQSSSASSKSFLLYVHDVSTGSKTSCSILRLPEEEELCCWDLVSRELRKTAFLRTFSLQATPGLALAMKSRCCLEYGHQSYCSPCADGTHSPRLGRVASPFSSFLQQLIVGNLEPAFSLCLRLFTSERKRFHDRRRCFSTFSTFVQQEAANRTKSDRAGFKLK